MVEVFSWSTVFISIFRHTHLWPSPTPNHAPPPWVRLLFKAELLIGMESLIKYKVPSCRFDQSIGQPQQLEHGNHGKEKYSFKSAAPSMQTARNSCGPSPNHVPRCGAMFSGARGACSGRRTTTKPSNGGAAYTGTRRRSITWLPAALAEAGRPLWERQRPWCWRWREHSVMRPTCFSEEIYSITYRLGQICSVSKIVPSARRLVIGHCTWSDLFREQWAGDMEHLIN